MNNEGKVASVIIRCANNNTIINAKDTDGNILAFVSAKDIGAKGSDKTSIETVEKIAESVGSKLVENDIEQIIIYVMGYGNTREKAIKTLQGFGLEIKYIIDKTPIPHNGCRPPRRNNKINEREK